MFGQKLQNISDEVSSTSLMAQILCAIALGALLSLSANAADESSLYSRTFNLTEIRELKISQGYDVKVIQGDKEYVRASGPQEVLSQISAEFYEGRLSIHSQTGALLPVAIEVGVQSLEKVVFENVSFAQIDHLKGNSLKISRSGDGKLYLGDIRSNSLKIVSQGTGEILGDTLTSDDLSLTISGTGQMNIHVIKANHLHSSISGSAGVHIDKVGEVDTSAIQLSGSGLFDAANVIIQEAEIAIAGSANALVNVLENLDVNTSGSGTVTYYGNPDINTGIFGTGLVRKAF
jgi:hypothetical protein